MRLWIRLCALVLISLSLAFGQAPELLPTGQAITPLAIPGASFIALNPHLADDPAYTADHAVTTLLSPDHRTLLILTSGYNKQNFTSGPSAGKVNDADSGDYVFVYDVSGPAPRQTQALHIPVA